MKNKHLYPRIVLILILVFSLPSCGSFNSYDIKINPGESTPKAAVKNQAVVCPIYELPDFPTTPALPIKEMFSSQSIKLGDIEKIERKHIEELRTHIIEFKKQMKENHERYLLNCLRQ